MSGPIRFVIDGPIWLDSYEYGERMLVPGWVDHTTDYWPYPCIATVRLEGPGVPSPGIAVFISGDIPDPRDPDGSSSLNMLVIWEVAAYKAARSARFEHRERG